MIELKVTVKSFKELSTLLSKLTDETMDKIDVEVKSQLSSPEPVQETPKTTKKKTTKTTDEGKTQSQNQSMNGTADSVKNESNQETPVVPDAKKDITKQQLIETLSLVTTKNGLQAARDLLRQFNKEDGSPCGKISDLTSDQWPLFHELCLKQL